MICMAYCQTDRVTAPLAHALCLVIVDALQVTGAGNLGALGLAARRTVSVLSSVPHSVR